MKSSLILTFTCACILVLGSCSDRDPVSPRFEAGPLGAVEIGKDEKVQIRSLLSQTIVPSLGMASRYSIEAGGSRLRRHPRAWNRSGRPR